MRTILRNKKKLQKGNIRENSEVLPPSPYITKEMLIFSQLLKRKLNEEEKWMNLRNRFVPITGKSSKVNKTTLP